MKFKFFFLIVFFLSNQLSAQLKNTNDEKIFLDSLANIYKSLNKELEISISGLEISDFINGISESQGLNIGVAREVKGVINQSFSGVQIKDVLYFLTQQYNLDIKTYGDIIYLLPRAAPVEVPKDKFSFVTLSENGQINIDVENKSTAEIIRGIGSKTGKNILLDPLAKNTDMSLFLSDIPITVLLENVAKLSGNVLKVDSLNNLYEIHKSEALDVKKSNEFKNNNTTVDLNGIESRNITIQDSLISVKANSVSAQMLIQGIADQLGIDFVFIDDLSKQMVTMQVEGINFSSFLRLCLAGTKSRYVEVDKTFIIGKDGDLNINTTKFFKFNNRTYENILELIPKNLSENLEIFEFSELNGFVINGNVQLIDRLIAFLESIDQRVPMVTIDIVIVDYNTNRSLSTGVSAGFGPQGDNVRSQGSVSSGGIDISLNSGSINKILSSFDEIGLFNLGRVAPDFYFNLQLLESQGVLKTRSTPKITTLNGQEASLSLGRTEYYLEIRNDIIGSQNPTVSNSQTYRSVNADLTVRIKPVISKDGQVTLEVNVNQTDFTTRINPNAPPGSVSRSFESIIRVGNDEMVILGGLESNSTNKSSGGIPLLSRIPILKYFFSSRDDSFQKSKLNIFIKPTIYK